MEERLDTVDTAIAAANFTTLAAALGVAGVIHVIDSVLMPSAAAAAQHFSNKRGERGLRHTRGNSGLRTLPSNLSRERLSERKDGK